MARGDGSPPGRRRVPSPRPSSAGGAARAIVIGAGMAGLAVGAALADRFDQVTILERDRLPHDAAPRKGVPQGRHLHLLLPAGAEALDSLLPGVLAEMAEGGAASGDLDRMRLSLGGHRLAPGRTGRTSVFASRPFIEAHVRRRVRDHPAVDILEAHAVRGLVPSADGRRVAGVRVTPLDGRRGESTMPAELVVDCSGRASRAPAWIAELGHQPPRLDGLPVEVRYATRTVRLPSEALDGDRHVLVGPTPQRCRGGAMTHIGPDEWMVTLFAMGGETVPMDPPGLERFARQLAGPELGEALRQGEPLDEPRGFRFPASARHRYEELRALPRGLLVAGDAVCSFNPIYGQGMSVAAIEAVSLARLLRDGPVPDARTWFRATAPVVGAAWELATGADLALPGLGAPRPARARVRGLYLRGLHAAAARDPVLSARFARVAGLLDHPRALRRPGAVARVAWGSLRRGREPFVGVRRER